MQLNRYYPLGPLKTITVSVTILKYFTLTLSVFLMFLNCNAQISFFNEINIGAKIGSSSLMLETPTDFSESINEFDNSAGLTFDFEFSKILTNHLDIGTEIHRTVLQGENQNPAFSAQDFHPAFDEPVTDPVEYRNSLLGQSIFLRLYLKSTTEKNLVLNINPFIRAGVGFISYKSYFKYIEAADDNIIFGKNTLSYHTRLSNVVYTLGTGFRTHISSELFILASIDFNLVHYDFLDVVHNYSDDGARRDLLGIYSQLKIGLFYTNSRHGKGRRGNINKKDYFPFGR